MNHLLTAISISIALLGTEGALAADLPFSEHTKIETADELVSTAYKNQGFMEVYNEMVRMGRPRVEVDYPTVNAVWDRVEYTVFFDAPEKFNGHCSVVFEAIRFFPLATRPTIMALHGTRSDCPRWKDRSFWRGQLKKEGKPLGYFSYRFPFQFLN